MDSNETDQERKQLRDDCDTDKEHSLCAGVSNAGENERSDVLERNMDLVSNSRSNVVDEDEMPYESWALGPADEALPDNVVHLMSQVLQNDMLVENILEKIILDNDRVSIRSSRLVCRQWLCAIAKLYRKMKRPQFIVNTNKDNALLNEPRPRPFFEQHTLLYEFIKPMVRHDRIEGFIPTFSLTLGASYFRKSNYMDFVNCLVQCGPSLVELYIRFPKNSAMSFLLPPTISLPNLNTFGVSFSGQSLVSHTYPLAYNHQHDYFPNNCSIHLVQTILNASANLRRLQFMSCPNPMNPPDMENLYLPDNLTSIYIDTPFRDFELFLRKGFPYLTEIRINATIALYSEEAIYDLFSKLGSTLHTIWLTGSAGTRRSLPIRLPRMEHLTKFVMFKPWELEERTPPMCFEETFPLLETLVFANQTEYSFNYLMSGMRSTTVKTFCVWLTSLGPNPPVMNFPPPIGFHVGEDQPNIDRLGQHHLEAANLHERRERMRQALQQMRLDIMQRHHRRLREQPVAAVRERLEPADEVPQPNGEGPRAQIIRGVAMVPRHELLDERPRANDGAEVVQLDQNNREADLHPPPRQWRRNPGEMMEQDRYRFLAQRARYAWEYRQRIREQRQVGYLQDLVGVPGVGIHRVNGGPRDELDPVPAARDQGRRPFYHPHIGVPIHRQPNAPPNNIGGVQVVIERVRPPYVDVDVGLNPPPRVIIRRLDDNGWIGHHVRPAMNLAAVQENPNNELPIGPRPVRPVRPEGQNPIRAVYQRMLNRMEVDREEEDNAIHRNEERGDENIVHRDEILARVAEQAANDSESDDGEHDSDNDNIAPGHGGDGVGRMVRRLEVLAAVAVANQQVAGQNQDDVPVPPHPNQQQIENFGGDNQVNDAVREAFRVMQDNEPLGNPDMALVVPRPLEQNIRNGNINIVNINDDEAPPERPPSPVNEIENNNNGHDARGVVADVRRRFRQQEARNLRDLRQLRHRMLLDWAHPRARPVPLGGAVGNVGPHVPLPERPVTMTKEKMQCINLAFPNLVKLTINISGPEICGLKYIFDEMRALQSLRIIVENSLWSIKWDPLLTGIPADFCDAVRSSPELWNEVYLNENHVSIRNMTKLEELMILECIKMDEQRDQHRSLEEHYISDVAFHFGLLKMKELKHVTVTPGFAPSPAMYKKWYEEKGFKIKARPRVRLDLSYYESEYQ